VNVQPFANLSFINTAMLALVTIAGTGAACLAFPVGTIIRIKATSPYWVVFTNPVFSLPLGKALSITIKSGLIFDLIRFSLKLFPTPVAIHNYSLPWAFGNQFGSPLPHTFSITKIVFLGSTWRNTLFLATPITFNDSGGKLAFLATVIFPSFLDAIWFNLNRVSAIVTMYFYSSWLWGIGVFLSSNAIRCAFTATILSIPCLRWRSIKRYSALLADKLYGYLCLACQFLGGKFSTAFIRAGFTSTVLFSPRSNLELIRAYRTNLDYSWLLVWWHSITSCSY